MWSLEDLLTGIGCKRRGALCVWGVRKGKKWSPFTELGKMVDVGLGDFPCGQAEMTSQWCHSAAGHAGVKVCARGTGVRAGGPGW